MTSQRTTDRRSQLIRAFTFLGGVYFFLYFVLPESVLEQTGVKSHHEAISNGFIAVGAMAIGLGLFNLLSAHGSRLLFRKKGWPFSFALLIGLFSMIVVTAAQWRQSLKVTAAVRKSQIIGEFAQRIVDDVDGKAEVPALRVRVESLQRYTHEYVQTLESELVARTDVSPLRDELLRAARTVRDGTSSLDAVPGTELSSEMRNSLTDVAKSGAKLGAALSAFLRQETARTSTQRLYAFLYEGIFNQLGSAMFSLLGVYIAAAAYRAFRIRSIESALMMAAALIVMLGQISLGRAISEDLASYRQWLLEVPNSAAFRAIRLGAAVAGLMLAIRMWLSIESKSFSAGKKQ